MQTIVSAKFSFQSDRSSAEREVRRIELPQLEELCYFNAITTARRLFSVPKDFDVSLQWRDEDGDVIELSSEVEMREYLSCVRRTAVANAPTVLKLAVVPAVSPVTELRAGHEVNNIRPSVLEELKQVLLTTKQNALEQHARVAKKAAMMSLRDRQDRIEAKLVKQRWIPQQTETASSTAAKLKTESNPIIHRHYNLRIKDERAVHAVTPNTPFKHRWVIRNDSPFSVKHGMQLKFTAGERMCSDDYSIPIGPIKIGGTTVVEALLLSPNKKGSHSANFQCTLSSGALIGPVLKVYTMPKGGCSTSSKRHVEQAGLPKKSHISEPYTSSMFNYRLAAPGPAARVVESTVVAPKVSTEDLWKHQVNMITDIGFGDIPRIVCVMQKHCEFPRQKPPFFTALEMQGIITDLVTVH